MSLAHAVFDARNAKVSNKIIWATDLQSYPVKVEAAIGDTLLNLRQTIVPIQGETTVQQNRGPEQKESYALQKKFYEGEERKLSSKISVALLSKQQLQ